MMDTLLAFAGKLILLAMELSVVVVILGMLSVFGRFVYNFWKETK